MSAKKNRVYVSKVNNVSALASSNCYSTMPAEQHTMHQRDKCPDDLGREDRIQMAIEGVDAGQYRSYKVASIQLNVR